MRHFLFALLCLTFTAPASAQQTDAAAAGLDPEGLERYTAWVTREIAEHRLPMAETMIFRHGTLGYHDVQGVSDVSAGNALEAGQLYHLMSMTKPIVTVAFMMLYEEGYFQLDDAVADYLPEFREMRVALSQQEDTDGPAAPAETAITIKQVLSHTAGFSHGLAGTPFDNAVATKLYLSPQADIAARVKTLASLPLIGEPGKQWFYSASPDILARLIEVFSGQPVNAFLQERLFDPLGMDDTGYNIPAAEQDRLVANHDVKDDALSKAALQLPSTGNTVFGGTHGLYSTAADYLKFCRMLLNRGELDGHHYLSPATVDYMTTNQVGDLRGGGQGFGLGFGVITDITKTDVIGNNGQYFWSGAYSTYFFIDPAEDLIAIMLSQRSPYSGYHERMLRQMVYQTLDAGQK